MKPDYEIDAITGCWEWQKSKLVGYGIVGTPENGERRAHRAYYARVHGPIPEGYDVHHRCRNVGCVNPDHLEALHRRVHDVEHFMADKGRDFDTIQTVLADHRAGKSMRSISRDRGIPFSTIQDWCAGRRWPELIGGKATVIEITRICEAVDCERHVVGRAHKRFCSARCRSRTNERKWREQANAA